MATEVVNVVVTNLPLRKSAEAEKGLKALHAVVARQLGGKRNWLAGGKRSRLAIHLSTTDVSDIPQCRGAKERAAVLNHMVCSFE